MTFHLYHRFVFFYENKIKVSSAVVVISALTLSVPNFRRHLSTAFSLFQQTIVWKDVHM